jgi:16S rRNA (guanine966-N2)-methyltransferase
VRIRGKQQIQTVPGLETRPTASRVREAVFNIWQFEIAGCRWLDLCAGTGAMGAEALCRGAALAIGIEQASRACAVIEQNWRKLAQPDQSVRVLRMDVVRGLEKMVGEQFDRIYFDPPYASDLYGPVIEAIASHHFLKPTGMLAVEHGKDRVLPQFVGDLTICQTRHYGKTTVTFYAVLAGDLGNCTHQSGKI